MKSYQCTKTVEAFKIVDITIETPQRVVGDIVEQEDAVIIHSEDGEYWTTNRVFLARHQPQIGGYLVKYGDISFSPAKAFEEGYVEITTGVECE